ncbi:hypothetical protein CBR_g54913 [Chara braunii]|uniref:Integrase catalytic domain-containing protein n=1 Tax=Chara braunii TaxID=69332 RepID=A0A388JPV7_CHABU|nr:hypothetical protein CBR_g54913 [Chara braunii]|eukprot:GBG59811.1 hypothetical protein CBR_g54913 [Chara braunii]
MTKCPKEFASAIETLQSLVPGHPSLQWLPLRYLEDSVLLPVPTTAPSGPVASPNFAAPAVRVTVPRPATARPAAPPFAPLAGTPGAHDVEVGRIAPANEPPPVRDGVGSAAFDEESTRAFIESRMWGRDVGTSVGVTPVFKSARQSHAAWVAEHGVPAEEVPPSVSDSSPTLVPTTTGAGRSAPPMLTGSLDPLQRIRDLAAAQSEAPGGLLDVEVLGGRDTTGRGRGTYRQQAVTSYYSDPLERAWHLQIMRFIVESGMSFNCTKLESFKRMFTMTILPGVPRAPTPKLPSYHMLRTTLLDELDGEVQKCVRPVLDTSRKTGCTIMSDGWSNIRGQTLCNYLVGTEIGVAYVATDVMHGKKDASALANAWLKRVKSMYIDLSDITTFVTDSAGVNVEAMKVFQKDESVKHIFWIPCVVHIMDLILEDIGEIDWVTSLIAQTRLVTRFFKRHGYAREVLEAYSKKTLLLPAETRFDTNVIMMTRLVKLRAELTQVVGDDHWRETVWSTIKIGKDAAEVTACIGSPPWWENLRALCKMLEPIMDMLRLVDSDTRHISKICDALVKALVQFGYPEGSPQHREVQRAVIKLHTREPPFDELTIRRAMDTFDHPASFLSSKKAKFPHTVVFAGKILRIWATTSPCERAWSHWSFIHSKSRNRLEVPRAEKLVRCHWNLRLLDRPSLCDDGAGERPGVRTGMASVLHHTSGGAKSDVASGGSRDKDSEGRVGKGMASEEEAEGLPSKGSQGTDRGGQRNEGSVRDRESAKPEGTREDGKDLSTGESLGKVGESKRGPQQSRKKGDNGRTSPQNSDRTTPKKTKVSDARRKLAEIEKRTAEYKARRIEEMMAGNEGNLLGEGSREERRVIHGEVGHGGKDSSHKGTPSKKGKEKGDSLSIKAEKATTPPAMDSGASRWTTTPKVTNGCDGLWSLRERVLGWFDPEGMPKSGEKQRDSKEGEGTSMVGEAGSSQGGIKRIVATLTRALNKNQGYLADAKKKLTFDGANITEFLIDYENLAALLKWTEEKNMDHLGQHVSLRLGRDIMAIVASSESWKETQNEMMRKYLKAKKMATEAELAAVQRKNYATYNDFLRAFTLVALRIPGVTDRIMIGVCITPEGVEDAEPIDAFLEYEGRTLVVDNEMAGAAPTMDQLLIQSLEKGAPTVVAELREGPVTTIRRKDEKDSWGAMIGPKEELIAMAVEGGRDAVMNLAETWTQRERRYLVNQAQEGQDTDQQGREFFLIQMYNGIFREIGRLLIGNKQPMQVSLRAREEVGKYVLRNGHLFKKEEGMMPRRVVCGRSRQLDIIQAMHDGLAGGHRSSKGTLAKIAPLYFWPGMAGMVAAYCQTCLICQERSSARIFEPLRPTRVLGSAHLVHLDLAVMPVSTDGYRYILDARANLSGYVEAIALKRKTRKGVADWIERFYLRHPFVRRFVADNGTEFVNHEVLSRFKTLCVPIKIIEPYYPEVNAPVERGHRTLKNTIGKLAADDLGNWPRYLKRAVFSENMMPKRTTGCIPAELWYGREIDFPVEALVPTWNRLDDNQHMSTEEQIAARCQQVARNEKALEDVVKRAMDSRMRDKARWDQVKEYPEGAGPGGGNDTS